VSAIVPCFRAERYLAPCLRAVLSSRLRPAEVIAVDDGSPDASARIARRMGAEVIRRPHGGPAAARNSGAARAAGDLLLFIDADVLIRHDSVERAVNQLTSRDVSAVIGIYAAEGGPCNTVTRFRNLLHRFVMLRGPSDCRAFFTAFGLIRRDAYEEVGGMDEDLDALEDVDLGHRLAAAGHSIFLDKGLEVVHIKRYSLSSMLRDDLLRRGVPWVRMALERRSLTDEFATDARERACTAAVGLALAGALGAVVQPWCAAAAMAALGAATWLQRDFYRYLARHGGPRLAFAGVALHLLYYLVCVLSVGLGSASFLLTRLAGAGAGPGSASQGGSRS